MATRKRPLSPHISIYAWGPHMALSILHRATGVALGVGTLGLACWLTALASGESAYATWMALAGSIIGKLVLLGFTAALSLHLCNGVRHLYWDAGIGFSVEQTKKSNIYVILGAVALTALVWAMACIG